MRQGSIFVGLFLWFVAAVFACTQEKAGSPNNPQPKPLLLISFDGFRYDYLSKTKTPHFDQLIAGGVKAKGLIPVFPSKTFPNHYAIATGLYPEHNGLVGNTMYDPKWDAWYSIGDRDAVENPRWYKGEPIWNTVEKQGLTAGTLFWVGSEAPIQGMRPTHWKPFNGAMPAKARIDTVVKWLSAEGKRQVDFATLYFEMIDGAGHNYGTESDTLIAAIQKADRLIGYLKKKLMQQQLWDKTNIIVLSDHGMTDLSVEKIIMLDAIINLNDTEYVIWGPATMVAPKPGKAHELYQQLKKNEEHYRVYKKEELPERYHLKHSRRIPALMVVADLGYTIMKQGFKEEFLEDLPSATHGYDNKEKEMWGLFVGHGPAFKESFMMEPFQNIYVYELMTHLLDIKPAPNDGSLDSVKIMLKGN